MLNDWQAAAINRPNQNQLAAKDHARFGPEGTGCSRLEASTFLRDSKLAPGGRPTYRPTDFHCHSGNRLGGASGVLSERLELRLLGWAGLGWAGLGWAGLGWAGLGWAGLGWAGLEGAGSESSRLLGWSGPRSGVSRVAA